MMRFEFETLYDQGATKTMARALRKTIRKQRSKRSHIFGALIIIAALLLTLPRDGEAFALTVRIVVTWLIAAGMAAVLIWEDGMNGYFARKRMLPGTERAVTVFGEESYFSETVAGKTEFYYGNIHALGESKEYFVFVFSPNHAQIYDKRTMTGGTEAEFRCFIREKTGIEITEI